MFPITMSFTVSTPAELARLVAATTGFNDQPNKPDPKAKPTPKSEPAAASVAAPAATQATQEQTAAASGATKALDYDADIKPLFLQLIQVKGRDAGRKIIDAFNPTKAKLPEAIGPAQYADALALIKKELGDAA